MGLPKKAFMIHQSPTDSGITRMKRAFFAVLAAFVLAFAGVARAGSLPPVTLAGAHDMKQLGARAAERRLPILLMFAQHGCSYCSVVEEDFLKPMLRSGDYTDKVIIRRVMLDDYATLTDFDGQPVAVDAFSRRYHAVVTPTLVFVDPQGRELAKRLVGITTPDFYGGDLDKAIDTALQRMHSRSQVSDAR